MSTDTREETTMGHPAIHTLGHGFADTVETALSERDTVRVYGPASTTNRVSNAADRAARRLRVTVSVDRSATGWVLTKTSIAYDVEALLDAITAAELAPWVMTPGPGTVQIDVPDGAIFVSDPDGGAVGGGYTIGWRSHDGSADERVIAECTTVENAAIMAVAAALRAGA